MKFAFLRPDKPAPVPPQPAFTDLELRQMKAMREALDLLQPVLASDNLSECHHRMTLAAAHLREAMEENW